MVDRNRRLVAAQPPESGNHSPTVNMLVGFIGGILTVMLVALVCCLLRRRKVIPLGKQRRGLKGELRVQERNLETEISKSKIKVLFTCNEWCCR